MGTESVESGQQLSAQQADSQTWSAVQGALVQVGSLAAGVLVTAATLGAGGAVVAAGLGAEAMFLANQAGAAVQNADTAANGGQVTSNSPVSMFAAATNNFGQGHVTHQELTQSLANGAEQGVSAVGMAAGMYAGGIVGSLFEDGESLVGSVGADAAEDLSSSGAAAPGARLASSVASSVTNQSFLAGSNYASQLIGIRYAESNGESSGQAKQQEHQAAADLVLNLAVSPALGVADMVVPQFESGWATAAGHLVGTGVPNLGLTWGSDLLNHQRLSLADAVQIAATSLTMTGIAMQSLGTSSALGSANGSENSAYDDQRVSDTSQEYDADQNASNNSGPYTDVNAADHSHETSSQAPETGEDAPTSSLSAAYNPQSGAGPLTPDELKAQIEETLRARVTSAAVPPSEYAQQIAANLATQIASSTASGAETAPGAARGKVGTSSTLALTTTLGRGIAALRGGISAIGSGVGNAVKGLGRGIANAGRTARDVAAVVSDKRGTASTPPAETAWGQRVADVRGTVGDAVGKGAAAMRRTVATPLGWSNKVVGIHWTEGGKIAKATVTGAKDSAVALAHDPRGETAAFGKALSKEPFRSMSGVVTGMVGGAYAVQRLITAGDLGGDWAIGLTNTRPFSKMRTGLSESMSMRLRTRLAQAVDLAADGKPRDAKDLFTTGVLNKGKWFGLSPNASSAEGAQFVRYLDDIANAKRDLDAARTPKARVKAQNALDTAVQKAKSLKLKSNFATTRVGGLMRRGSLTLSAYSATGSFLEMTNWTGLIKGLQSAYSGAVQMNYIRSMYAYRKDLAAADADPSLKRPDWNDYIKPAGYLNNFNYVLSGAVDTALGVYYLMGRDPPNAVASFAQASGEFGLYAGSYIPKAMRGTPVYIALMVGGAATIFADALMSGSSSGPAPRHSGPRPQHSSGTHHAMTLTAQHEFPVRAGA
jgi:hypothetical protein